MFGLVLFYRKLTNLIETNELTYYPLLNRAEMIVKRQVN